MLAAWMHANLEVQGYCLTHDESRALRWGLRFPTALCLAIFVTGLLLQSAALLGALVPIGVVAGWTARHPFDLIWNHGMRHLGGGPLLPANPSPRRHGFKVGTVWLGAVGLLFAFGQPTAAVIAGVPLALACGAVTVANFCIPSTVLSLWWRRQGAGAPAA
jgi:hypothetical protein